jgi:hypothetical protein
MLLLVNRQMQPAAGVPAGAPPVLAGQQAPERQAPRRVVLKRLAPVPNPAVTFAATAAL